MLQLYCRRKEKEGQQADAEKPQDVHVVGVAECDIEESSIDEESCSRWETVNRRRMFRMQS